MKRMVYKLIDKSMVLGVELESNATTVTIKDPMNIAPSHNPQTGQTEIGIIPMDLIFADVLLSKNTVTLKHSHIMYVKPLEDFPSYDNHYMQSTTNIETVQSSGIIT